MRRTMYALVFTRTDGVFEVSVNNVYWSVEKAKEAAEKAERATWEEDCADDADAFPFKLPAWMYDEDANEHLLGEDGIISANSIYSGGTWIVTEVGIEE